MDVKMTILLKCLSVNVHQKKLLYVVPKNFFFIIDK